MLKDTNKTELGIIRSLANTEEYVRKAEKELSSNMFMSLSKEEYKRVFNINGINIVKAKEDIQEIKERKIQNLVSNYQQITTVTSEDIDKTFAELESKSKVASYWYSIIRSSENTCRIIDKYTGTMLLETDIMIANKIIKATFE